jgi:dCMP deaminase
MDLIKNIVETFSCIDWDTYFMSIALLASSRSQCHRLRVGCVIVKDNRVVSMGYNGFLPGAPHDSVIRDGHEQATVHAEQNAISDAACRGVPIEGSTAYITHYPCLNCAKLLASSGVTHIKYHSSYHDDPLVEEIVGKMVHISKI